MKILHYMLGLPPVRDGGLVRYVDLLPACLCQKLAVQPHKRMDMDQIRP